MVVVVVLPVSDLDTGFEQVPPLVELQALVTDPVVARLCNPVGCHESVVPGLSATPGLQDGDSQTV